MPLIDGREAMARLAARLMNDTADNNGILPPPAPVPATPSAAAKATIPRTVPSPQKATGNIAAPAWTDGPSLRGSAEQLAAAREFMSGATPGNSRSRSGGRTRLLSKGRSPEKNREPSARSSFASAYPESSYAPAVATPRPRPSTMAAGGSTSKTSAGTAGVQNQWQAFAQPVVKKEGTTPAQLNDVSAQKPLPPFSPVLPSSPKVSASAIKKENTAPAAHASTGHASGTIKSDNLPTKSAPWQLAEAETILKNNASDKQPPHLRARQDSFGLAPEDKATAAPLSSRILDIKINKSNPEALGANTHTENNPIRPVQVATTSTTHTAAALQSVAEAPSQQTGKPISNAVSTPAPFLSEKGQQVLQAAKDEIAAISDRITNLERENLRLQRQVEKLIQAEERRKFLGSGSAKEPFSVNVKDPNGNLIRVQATADLKVGDLIRRIRTKAGLSSTESKDPRVSFKEAQLGHSVMLGEVGVVANSVLLFSYSA